MDQNVVNCSQPRRRIQVDCSQPSLTDQSYKKSCDINNIMAQYAKTGLLPSFRNKEPRYVDNTQIPSFLEAHELVQEARELFYDLPATVRKMMDNNPANLEAFLADENNKDVLIKYGLVEMVKEPPKETPLTKENFEEVITKAFQPTQPKG